MLLGEFLACTLCFFASSFLTFLAEARCITLRVVGGGTAINNSLYRYVHVYAIESKSPINNRLQIRRIMGIYSECSKLYRVNFVAHRRVGYTLLGRYYWCTDSFPAVNPDPSTREFATWRVRQNLTSAQYIPELFASNNPIRRLLLQA